MQATTLLPPIFLGLVNFFTEILDFHLPSAGILVSPTLYPALRLQGI